MQDIVILKQDKGRGIVILDKKSYDEKCSKLINNNKFKKLNQDPTAKLERQMQRALGKIKTSLSDMEYDKLY